MAKISSSAFKVFLVDGVSMLGAKPKAVVDKVTNVLQNNTHGLGDAWQESSATGTLKGELSQSGAFFDTASDSMHEAWKALTGVVRTVVYGWPNLIGGTFVGWAGIYEGSYAPVSKVAELVQADATYAVSGQVDRGLIVQDWKAHTADWITGTELSLAITRVSSTATAVSTPAHGYAVGSTVLVTVAGAVQSDYNGRQTAMIVDATTFTFTVANSPTTPATGTITGGVTTDYTLDPTNISVPITSNSIANPTVVTTPGPHKLTSNDKVLVTGSNSTPSINGTQVATVLSPTSYSVPVNVTVAGTAGAFVRANSNNGGAGYSAASLNADGSAVGFTNFVATQEHSDDDVSYSSLLAFTDNVVVPFAERKTVAGVVKRFVRNNGNVTGAGKITTFGGFKRNAPL